MTLTQGLSEVTVLRALPEDNLNKGDNFPVGGANWNEWPFAKSLKWREKRVDYPKA